MSLSLVGKEILWALVSSQNWGCDGRSMLEVYLYLVRLHRDEQPTYWKVRLIIFAVMDSLQIVHSVRSRSGNLKLDR
jgi:hypothetical protein